MKKKYFNFQLLVVLLFTGLFASAQSNQYLHFDGSDDYIAFDDASSYIYNSNTITMAGWFYTDALVYGQGMMSLRGGGTGDGQMYVIQLNNGSLECRVITQTGLHQVQAPDGTIVAGQWQHIAWVFDMFTVKLYVDGNLVGTGSASGTYQSNDRPFSVGKCILNGYNFIYGGRADEVSLWNKALTQTEIQNMMTNELTGSESDLVVYYKFDQGTPGGDNTSISQVNAYGSDTSKNADLYNFALTGTTSNFNGTLDASFQTIAFSTIPNKTIYDAPFDITATASSGLPVTYTIESGPATISGNTITLTGTAGDVVVKASQAGDATYNAAEDVYTTFSVLDPAAVLVTSDILHPLAGDVYAPSLMPIKVAVKSEIQYTDLFSVSTLNATIDGNDVTLTDHGNGFFTGWWTPTSYGSHTLEVQGTNNFGNSSQESITFNLTSSVSDQNVYGTNSLWLSSDEPSLTETSDLPSHIGAFTQITGTLHIDCPTGGCDPWDRVSTIEVQGKDGEWYEIIRYLTPYGISCQSTIDLTDFKSLLSGRTTFRVNLTTYDNGFEYSLELDYTAGTDPEPYGNVQKLWYQTYQFGDPADLQPTEDLTMDFPTNSSSAKIKLVSTGHGWSSNAPYYDANTNNAAEFSNNTHHIWVNGSQTFTQNNWVTCLPNPDGCNFQAGTYQYNRAGWCPGSIAQFFDYDMTPFVGNSSVALDYVFDESYMDYCHPNNPDCISGVTCNDCNDSFNPHLIVSSYLISFGASPLVSLATEDVLNVNNVSIYPNPSAGLFYVQSSKTALKEITIHDIQGRVIKTVAAANGLQPTTINIRNQATGIYLATITDVNGTSITKRIVVE
ncbi:LamG-like jellyroll fold domain-containing protein [Neptunitalea lumnitzerae]|uniref:LamG-like jellyroll fold domain-containing protein n=1 Tax=Neptunitalea lumnitzerae TaxID=2965509 RepID=A0ABQ5MFA9_9FLAO|nr:LamG-like jellyroll fold domain-containing protein [Neptunitalea sp. Y10]GLB48083.1 hypothetical protein Y10_04510 [Neptunitalea sp. Y10]